jgi:hypothetical protein
LGSLSLLIVACVFGLAFLRISSYGRQWHSIAALGALAYLWWRHRVGSQRPARLGWLSPGRLTAAAMQEPAPVRQGRVRSVEPGSPWQNHP